jgi:hypothetical protein
MSELNPDPKMRPSVDALQSKLKQMSMLQNKPEAVTLVIGDLAYHYLYREQPRPAHLWSLMTRMMNLWQMATQSTLPNDTNINMLVAAGQDVPEGVAHQLSYRFIHDQQIWHCACGEDFYSAEKYQAHVKPAASAGDSPSLKEMLEANQVGMKQIIWKHVPTARGINVDCSCSRQFAHEEAWADHVRIRVQRYLNNQFPPIGEANE